MGCGQSKHDVVTGNTTTVRKPLEAESVKGQENETIKRQESCRCKKTNDISAVVSSNQPKITVEINTNKLKEKKAGGDCGEKPEGETNDQQKHEEKETTTLPLVTAIVSENILPEAEKVDSDTIVEEEKSTEDKTSGNVDTEILLPEVEEPKLDVETPITTESEVQEVLTKEDVEIATSENVETESKENDDTFILRDEDEVDLIDNVAASKTVEITSTENDDTFVLKDEDEVDLIENVETPASENEDTLVINDEADLVETVQSASAENDESLVLKDEDKVDLLENVETPTSETATTENDDISNLKDEDEVDLVENVETAASETVETEPTEIRN
ncbi:enhancer of translation termination 1-like [Brassica napus]|uniref:enhancer of translation termination 1-like n=1 Tax=Brassica napus TaxID=3708 RepID=UPI00207AE791|nr:enhancer of translation termination 1-like [Brassica napus]